MSVYLGNTEIGQMFLGSTEIGQAYLGSTKVWEKGGITPPQPSLPYDAEIEYLQSSGTQFVDTGVIPNSETGIYIKVTKLNTQDTYMCGLRDTTGNTRWCIGNYPYYGYGTYLKSHSVNAYTTYTAYLNYLNNKKFSVPDYGDDVNLPTLSFTPSSNIRLFGSAGVSGSYSKWAGRMLACKISQGSDVIMDFIPVRVGQVGYMYDKVSGQLFGNTGSGNFTLGNDITT